MCVCDGDGWCLQKDLLQFEGADHGRKLTSWFGLEACWAIEPTGSPWCRKTLEDYSENICLKCVVLIRVHLPLRKKEGDILRASPEVYRGLLNKLKFSSVLETSEGRSIWNAVFGMEAGLEKMVAGFVWEEY